MSHTEHKDFIFENTGKVAKIGSLTYPIMHHQLDIEGQVQHRYGYVSIFSDEAKITGWTINKQRYILHNDDWPALIETTKTDCWETWYNSGLIHREDGPAEYNFKLGSYYWRNKGNLHRVYGPAMIIKTNNQMARYPYFEHEGEYIFSDGKSDYEWYRNGKSFTNELIEFCKDNLIESPLKMTQTDYDIFYLKYI